MDLPAMDHGTPHLCEVVPSLLASLGASGFAGTLDLPEVSRACVLLIDGLGWELLEAHAADAPMLSALRRRPVRVGYPATTVAGLAALGTGLASGEHGNVGYTFEVPGVGLLNALRWRRHPDGAELDPAFTAGDLQPLPTTFARSTDAGIATTTVSSAAFKDTPLTRATLSGGRYAGVHALGDLAFATLEALRPAPAFCYAYHADLDLVGHLHGPGTVPWRMQLRQVDRLVETLVEGLPSDTLLAVVADHGMVALDDTVVDVDATPALQDGVRELGGEPRARHVYTRDGATADVLAAWRETLGDRAWVAERDHAIALGWFGSRVSDRVRPRIGDVVVPARARSGILRRAAEPKESALVGHHGSLTSAEQLVPLALAYG